MLHSLLLGTWHSLLGVQGWRGGVEGLGKVGYKRSWRVVHMLGQFVLPLCNLMTITILSLYQYFFFSLIHSARSSVTFCGKETSFRPLHCSLTIAASVTQVVPSPKRVGGLVDVDENKEVVSHWVRQIGQVTPQDECSRFPHQSHSPAEGCNFVLKNFNVWKHRCK